MARVNSLQIWISQVKSRHYWLAVGFAVGALAALIGFMIALVGPFLTLAALFGILAGLYVITDIRVALYAIIVTLLLLPFGVFPVKIAITPTLLDLAMGGFLLVYLLQWMTGRRGGLRLTPVHAFVAVYVMWLIFTFALGLRHAMPTPANIRQFAETLLSIGMVFILSDLLRDPKTLRRLVLVIVLTIGLQALIAIALLVAPDTIRSLVSPSLANRISGWRRHSIH